VGARRGHSPKAGQVFDFNWLTANRKRVAFIAAILAWRLLLGALWALGKLLHNLWPYLRLGLRIAPIRHNRWRWTWHASGLGYVTRYFRQWNAVLRPSPSHAATRLAFFLFVYILLALSSGWLGVAPRTQAGQRTRPSNVLRFGGLQKIHRRQPAPFEPHHFDILMCAQTNSARRRHGAKMIDRSQSICIATDQRTKPEPGSANRRRPRSCPLLVFPWCTLRGAPAAIVRRDRP